MPELISLDHFHCAPRHYHIYLIQSSVLDHQPHYHNYFQVCYVTCCEILHRQEGDSVLLGPGDAFIIPPGFSHSLHFTNTYSEMYSLSFEESLFHAGFSQSNAHQFLTGLQSAASAPGEQSVRLRVLLGEDQRKSMQNLMDCLLRQQQSDCPPELSAASSLISSILYLLAQGYYRQPQNAGKLDELLSYNSTLLQCTRYIDQHYDQPLTLTSLAKQFGLSRSAFCSVFPQFTGLSLRRYIAQKRIAQAQLLIRSQPELTLAQIAAEVGYEDTSTFYRNFLRISGVSPSQYRTLWSEKE